MRCPGCGREGRADARFCDGCGTTLPSGCSACGRELRADARFCDGCGAPIGAGPVAAKPPAVERSPRDYTPKHLADRILHSKSALEGERKQVTVLFADVKSSLELSGQVDPEVWHGILDRLFQLLSDGVHRFEGTVNQYTGDGIMALFGAPIAHEDHAQRACFAGLHLREQLQAYAREVKREHGLGLSVRMGVHSGDVVVGKIGDDLRMDYTAQGHTVGLAHRMQELAEPNTCYLSDATASLASGYFDLEDLGKFSLKGVADPVAAFELRGLGALRTRFDASRARGLTRFVGRDDDMQALESALEHAEAGRGQVVGVVAEAGTGKSRLCFEFVERCRAQGMQVLEGQAVAHAKSIPYLPMLQVFRAYYGIDDTDDDRSVREKIAGRLLLLDEGFRDFLPVMFEFFAVADPHNPTPPMDPDAKKRQMFTVLRTLVERQDPSARPFVTLIEDLHWMDPASEEFLVEWVDAMAGANRLLVVNFRPEFHADWMQKSYYRQLPLAPLGSEAIRDLLDDLLGADPSIRGLAEAIHARTGGNPFFTEEVVQALIESGHLEGTRGAYRLVIAVEDLEVPATVQPLLASRIDRLAEREKHVLQIAAVIGVEFGEPVLAQVANLSDRDLGAALDALKQGEFIYEQAIYPVAEFAFKHPLTQEVALTTQLRERRAQLHAEVARAIEELLADKLDERAALLGHHWEQAGEPIVAARWYRRAAERVSRSDVAAGQRHWKKVRELVAGHEVAEAAQLGVEACSGVLSVGFRLGLSDAERNGIYAEGRRFCERADDVALALRLESAASASFATAGSCERALEHALAAERMAEEVEDPVLRANGRYSASYVWMQTGETARAAERLDELIAVAREQGDLPAPFGGDPMLAVMLALRGQIEVELGSVARAHAIADESIRVAKERGLLESEGWANGFHAWLALVDGDVERALPRTRRGLEIAEKIGSPFSRVWSLEGNALVLAMAGRPECLELAERSLAVSREENTALEGEASHLSVLARACVVVGQADRALALSDEAIEVTERRGTWSTGANAVLARSQALRAAGGLSAAGEIRATLDRVEEFARRGGTPNHVPLGLLERASLAALEGDRAGRERHLRQALEQFRRIEADFRVAQIERMLAESA